MSTTIVEVERVAGQLGGRVFERQRRAFLSNARRSKFFATPAFVKNNCAFRAFSPDV